MNHIIILKFKRYYKFLKAPWAWLLEMLMVEDLGVVFHGMTLVRKFSEAGSRWWLSPNSLGYSPTSINSTMTDLSTLLALRNSIPPQTSHLIKHFKCFVIKALWHLSWLMTPLSHQMMGPQQLLKITLLELKAKYADCSAAMGYN